VARRRRPSTELQIVLPNVQVQHDDDGEALPIVEAEPATLIKNPRTIDELWAEYQFGIGGRKPARLFTRGERGKVKYNYYRRNIVWEVIARLVRAGETAQTAIDRIRIVYGQSSSVTVIVNKMKADRRIGGHPQLRG
jgi:Transcriptional activator of glycolytic enzymes